MSSEHHNWDTGGAPAGDSKRPDVVCSDPTGEQKYVIDTKINRHLHNDNGSGVDKYLRLVMVTDWIDGVVMRRRVRAALAFFRPLRQLWVVKAVASCERSAVRLKKTKRNTTPHRRYSSIPLPLSLCRFVFFTRTRMYYIPTYTRCRTFDRTDSTFE
jgi:hypothetical protein